MEITRMRRPAEVVRRGWPETFEIAGKHIQDPTLGDVTLHHFSLEHALMDNPKTAIFIPIPIKSGGGKNGRRAQKR